MASNIKVSIAKPAARRVTVAQPAIPAAKLPPVQPPPEVKYEVIYVLDDGEF